MAKAKKPTPAAAALTAITAAIVKGLVERNAAGGLALTHAGRAILQMLVSTI
jgi:hypothetical protein